MGNRCALIFDDISALLGGLKLFVNKVKYYQSGNIIAIARDKNGFIEYLEEAQYADIKLNVVIKGKHNSIIGEVQFLLRAMKEYKDMAHNLYSIQRKEDAFKSSVSATLPILLNQQKEIFGIASSGNVKKMCALMITQNLSFKDLMSVDKKNGNIVFHNICNLGHLELLLFLEAKMTRQEFVEHMFRSHSRDQKCIENAIIFSHLSITKHLFDMKEIQDRYKNNDPMIFRMCFYLFTYNSNAHFTDYVLSALQISKEKIVQMLSYKCPQQPGYKKGGIKYHQFTIIGRIISWGSFEHLQHLIEVIGEEAFADNAFHLNADAMSFAVSIRSTKTIECILSIDQIKEKYLSDNDVLFRLISTLNSHIKRKEIVQYIVDALGLTEAKLSELNEFRNIDVSKIIPFIK